MNRKALGVVVALAFAMSAIAYAGGQDRPTGGVTASDYDRTGPVGDLELPDKPKRVAGSGTDSVGPGASSTSYPVPETVVSLPSPCEFDNTMPGCPGYVEPPREVIPPVDPPVVPPTNPPVPLGGCLGEEPPMGWANQQCSPGYPSGWLCPEKTGGFNLRQCR